VVSLFSRTRRKTPVDRTPRARLMVERLEGRDAPSSLDVTSLTLPPADSTDPPDSALICPIPAPLSQSQTDPGAPTVPLVFTATSVTPPPPPLLLPQAGDTQSTSSDQQADLTLAAPMVMGVNDEGSWNYTVTGMVSDSNPGSLTVLIKVDGVDKGGAAVTPVLNPDGTPTGTGTWSLNFDLPACNNANDMTRFGTAQATDGTRFSAVTSFTFDQHPVMTTTLPTT
jgi:hypothetical protein